MGVISKFASVLKTVIVYCVLMGAEPVFALEGGADWDLRWRELGPYRGGRTTAVAGAPSQPNVFYMGATGGGVWKTENAGGDWRQLGTSAFGTGSVGAIAVSPSDPNTLYVGMGESPYRLYSSSFGDGVYRSDDGGDTWRHLGLEKSRQIGAIVIHPKNTDVVLVAAQGSPWGSTEERGIYKSADGGKTWRRTLHVNPLTGGVDLAADPANPNILYATVWEHDYDPWFLKSGGGGSGIFKSVDGGETWKRIENGLPSGRMGKAGVAPAFNKPGKVWVMVESDPDTAGLYQSDDYGENWRLVNGHGEIRTRPWYYTHVYAHPQDQNTVYSFVQNAYLSTDSGESFDEWTVAGYDFHALWINPENPDIFIVGSDAGASVTVDGGKTWSSVHNQPTAQLYRISVDNQIPYRVYSAQQDNTTVSMSSRPNWGGLDAVGYIDVGGGETGYVEPDPFDPFIVYATTELGVLMRLDRRTGGQIIIQEPLRFPEGVEPRKLKYRFSVNSPVVASKHKRCVLYHGAQVLLRSTDCGDKWEAISPDLTFDDESRQGKGGGPYTNEVINHYGAIVSISESPIDNKIIWTGANDGAVAVTRNSGKSWEKIETSSFPPGSVNTIAASNHHPGRAFAAVFGLAWNDYRPYLMRTDDYGKTWRAIDNGLPVDAPARVIRDDARNPDLLFAGLETGVYYSRDGGENWRSLQLNMPAVPVTDLKIAGDDLVISTQGRGVWMLNDISPLRLSESQQSDAQAVLLKPAPAYRVTTNWNERSSSEASIWPFDPNNFGETIPTGAVIDFLLPQSAAIKPTEVQLEIIDQQGNVIRRIEEISEGDTESLPGGHTRLVWDLRKDALPEIPGVWDSKGIRPVARIDDYVVRLTYGDQVLEQPLSVEPDPRFPGKAKDIEKQNYLSDRTEGLLLDIISTGRRVEQVRRCLAGGENDQAAIGAVEKWLYRNADPRITINNDRVNYGASFIFDVWFYLDAVAAGVSLPLTKSYDVRIDELTAKWAEEKRLAENLTEESGC